MQRQALIDRATKLDHESVALGKRGLHEQALVANKAALTFYRQLAQAQPEHFLADVARVLQNQSMEWSALAQTRQAVSASEESIAITRGLVAADPQSHTAALARALVTLSQTQVVDDDAEARALAAAEEAVALLRPLALRQPGRFQSALADALQAQFECLRWSPRDDAARAASNEAIALLRGLQARSGGVADELSRALRRRAQWLGHSDRHEEALVVQTQADAIGPPLPDEASEYAAMRHDAYVRLRGRGRLEEALRELRTAVSAYREVVARRPEASPQLAIALTNLSAMLSGQRRHAEALSAGAEAVALARGLAEAQPGAFEADLASALHNQSVALSALGRHQEASRAIEEAAAIRRRPRRP